MKSDLLSLEKLAEEVQFLRDRQDILDCVYRYSRGVDRRDIEILESAYHADGIDEHGAVVNTGLTFPIWVNAVHDQAHHSHLHNITNHSCEITGDTAHCESYVLCAMLAKDQKSLQLLGGRYVDRMERRDGEWRIAHRRSVVEWMVEADNLVEGLRAIRGYPDGRKGREDPSYDRPLQLSGARTEA